MNYKKALVSVALVPLLGASTFADGHMEGEMMMETTSITAKNASSANFLAEKNIIENQSGNIEMYNLDGDINRREMLKVMMNASQESVSETCTGVFSDLHSDDWGCKYAEAAVRAGFIAENDMFRPNDNVTQAEALKMVMQARGIQRDENSDWRA
jgi:hypothetical protein